MLRRASTCCEIFGISILLHKPRRGRRSTSCSFQRPQDWRTLSAALVSKTGLMLTACHLFHCIVQLYHEMNILIYEQKDGLDHACADIWVNVEFIFFLQFPFMHPDHVGLSLSISDICQAAILHGTPWY
ncbi:hypothetical protein BDZ91DRAFT_551797 [Kalaharituber pfeilii]|nr:hypothetical protein BDZ91DRAFT_551797 [Kalaharituber pfeilii]